MKSKRGQQTATVKLGGPEQKTSRQGQHTGTETTAIKHTTASDRQTGTVYRDSRKGNMQTD